MMEFPNKREISKISLLICNVEEVMLAEIKAAWINNLMLVSSLSICSLYGK